MITLRNASTVAASFLLLAGCSRPAPAPVDATAPDAAASAEVQARAAPGSPASPSAAAVPAIAMPERLRAVGTEPFWGADIDGATLTYSTPEFPDGIRITVARQVGATFVEYSGTLDGKPLTLRIEKGPCSDGMSDQIYTYRATRAIGPDIERGCARRR
ncbi:hypothetical protein OLX02_09665 [Novosphingobium sp. KCTC 2891]|uniref:COG3650 family protein n=1 Tax=Novosphingobium sp. KCTC 2891 TaxID=2989730 RepID=UPI002221495C|nr:hypothetical protein [Novosphingobium sp. KCTC 2891]MCW1383089.1 hypothetical protein [Novosphingobium sp. KCTC 2891]